MSFRLPQSLKTHLQPDTMMHSLEAEILGEQAAALGQSGRRVEKAIIAWENRDKTDKQDIENRLEHAVDAVYSYFIQREAAGINTHDYPIKFYRISAPILARLGTIKPS